MSKLAARQWGVDCCREALDVSHGPLATDSESTVSNTKLSFLALTEFRGENSVSASQGPIICVPKKAHRLFFAELTEFALATGKCGCREVRVYPTECGE